MNLIYFSIHPPKFSSSVDCIKATECSLQKGRIQATDVLVNKVNDVFHT